jgi:hypothetical protein
LLHVLEHKTRKSGPLRGFASAIELAQTYLPIPLHCFELICFELIAFPSARLHVPPPQTIRDAFPARSIFCSFYITFPLAPSSKNSLM